MCGPKGAVLLLVLSPFLATLQSCSSPTGPPSGVYKIDTVSFAPSNPRPVAAGTAPGIRVDSNTKLSSLAGGTLSSNLPYSLVINYTDNNADFQDVEITDVTVTYDDGAVEAATNKLDLPLRIAARQYEQVNSVSGGRIVKSNVSIIDGKIPGVVTRAESFALQVNGHFTKHDGSTIPFTIDEHFDAKFAKGVKSAAEVLQDR